MNALIDSLLICITRKIAGQDVVKEKHPFTAAFHELEQQLLLDLGHSWTLSEMAELVKLGKTNFYNKMKTITGFSPMSYLNQLRIKETQTQLSSTQKTITDIALAYGFSSSQHFATTFKKVTGKTPSAYRKSNSEYDTKDIPVW